MSRPKKYPARLHIRLTMIQKNNLMETAYLMGYPSFSCWLRILADSIKLPEIVAMIHEQNDREEFKAWLRNKKGR